MGVVRCANVCASGLDSSNLVKDEDRFDTVSTICRMPKGARRTRIVSCWLIDMSHGAKETKWMR